ncbi:ABC transporter substrate-binding protein [Arthrobacter gengyunqii]|uniref:ABC transporter substrate-binding protein n=1 Tax=Arthrobacter gengyunqii TaxID=2886940 RepID=A0A9X1S5R4_9MICC|nr:ABC transporter substrate-binding protein [Arthrobacter gengyunqii]MCC3267279.1 ABC transporter substrate-binding protein [Arthrobacter gengyunqii]MCC3268062.1 ABC transporter substrate-binding protein [Arthrobacter gengyunqii]UOY95480.1 ABC transporter substrate-binding protein [Arthrobacter gengyunqii]
MRFTRTSKMLSVAAVAVLALSACGGGDGSSESGAEGDTSRVIIADGSEPQNPLIPTNTNEVGGGAVLDLLFAGLISYDADGKPQNEMAESIETEDAQNYTIKLKEGKTFSNGAPVTAASFVDAWNYGAAAKNAQLSSYFFESIEGYDEASAEGSEVDTMSGLKVIDDTTFQVTLKQPESDWPLRLGYSAFYPMIPEALADPKTYGENPVGNGPYKFDGEGAWEHNQEINLVPNESYEGPQKAQNAGITFKIYQNDTTAYQDLISNNLDVLKTIPTSDVKNFKNDLGEERSIESPYAGNQTIAIPYYLENWSGEAGKLRRQALSMAIDREEITSVIFSNGRTPAEDFTAPVLDGYSADLPGSENLEFNPEKAKELWEEAEKISPYDESQPLTIAYNADKGDHKTWVEAVVNGLKNNLGIEVTGKPYATFKEVRTEASDAVLTGAIRSGWQADYPSLYNFLGPIYATGAGSNDARYENPEFDALLSEGLSASTVEEGNEKMNEAQEMLLEDLPAIPLWYQVAQGGWSTNVTNVEFGWNGVPLYYAITGK